MLKAEQYMIPSGADQPTTSTYKASAPATYIPEEDDPSQYPAPVDKSMAVGSDPIYSELTSTYNTSNIYGMHWLLDVDDWYGYGIREDGVGKPSYINTFQRGTQESVWETVRSPVGTPLHTEARTGIWICSWPTRQDIRSSGNIPTLPTPTPA